MPNASKPNKHDKRSSDTPSPDWDYWITLVTGSTNLTGAPDAVAYIVFRLVEQYLPAWTKTTSDVEREQVWSAFWTLLTSPERTRKPVQLTPQLADTLIGNIKSTLQTDGIAEIY